MSDIEDFAVKVQDWHARRVAQLNLVLEHPKAPIRIAGDDDEEIELSEEQAQGFRAGVRQALTLLGTLPFSITASDEEE